jgi:ankyrin repeat protein
VQAERLLQRHPELARGSLYVAAVLGDLATARRHLDADPSLATRRGGPRGWDALLYLCYGRVAPRGGDPLAVARLLLERGADPNTYTLLNDRYRFTALTGVMGEGEGGPVHQPPHPHARALAVLLLDAGADPCDGQGLYNTMFDASDAWLELLLARGLDASRRVNWVDDSGERMLDYLLGYAVRHGRRARTELLLAHAADPNGRDFYDRRPYLEHALRNGHSDIAELLQRHGARPVDLAPRERFRAACMRADAAEARRLLAEHPECRDDASPLHDAAELGHLESVRLLLDLGFAVDSREGPERWPGSTPLHRAALKGHLPVVRELVARGAPLDVREQSFGGTPIGAAAHAEEYYEGPLGTAVKDYLLEHTGDVCDLARHGRVERLAGILAREPARAGARTIRGHAPLHFLRDDTSQLDAVIYLLLAYGADLAARNEAGLTPLELARQEEQEKVAAALQSRVG